MQYFYGEDTYGAREAIVKTAHDKNATIVWLDRDSLLDHALTDIFSGQTGLFGLTLTIFRDPSTLPQNLLGELVELIKQSKNANTILWDRTKPDRRSVFWKTCQKFSREFPALSSLQLCSWLAMLAKKQHGTIDLKAARHLVSRIGPDRWRLLSELDRLLLINDSVTEELVKKEVTDQTVTDIFPLLDFLSNGDQKNVIKHLELLLEQGDSELYILSMLAYQFRVLLMVNYGLRLGKNLREISSEGKLHPYVVEKNSRAAATFTNQYLQDTLTKIMATDVAIKQGKLDARTGLIMLISGLLKEKALLTDQ